MKPIDLDEEDAWVSVADLLKRHRIERTGTDNYGGPVAAYLANCFLITMCGESHKPWSAKSLGAGWMNQIILGVSWATIERVSARLKLSEEQDSLAHGVIYDRFRAPHPELYLPITSNKPALLKRRTS